MTFSPPPKPKQYDDQALSDFVGQAPSQAVEKVPKKRSRKRSASPSSETKGPILEAVKTTKQVSSFNIPEGLKNLLLQAKYQTGYNLGEMVAYGITLALKTLEENGEVVLSNPTAHAKRSLLP